MNEKTPRYYHANADGSVEEVSEVEYLDHLAAALKSEGVSAEDLLADAELIAETANAVSRDNVRMIGPITGKVIRFFLK